MSRFLEQNTADGLEPGKKNYFEAKLNLSRVSCMSTAFNHIVCITAQLISNNTGLPLTQRNPVSLNSNTKLLNVSQ